MRVPYGVGLVVDLPLISQADTKIFKTSATIAAGDAKFRSDRLILTTLASKSRAFTSGGTYEVRPGDVITGHTSSATATVLGVRLTSGTWAGGDAAGTLFVEGDSGTFQSENLDVGSNLNVATIGGALSAAGVFVEIDSGFVAIGIPSSYMQCAQGSLLVRDAAGAEWCDTAMVFETTGNPLAFDPEGCIISGAGSSSGQSTTAVVFAAAPTLSPVAGNFVMCTKAGSAPRTGYVKSFTTATITLYAAMPGGAIDATWTINVYADGPRVPSHLVAVEAAAIGDAAFSPPATPAALPVLGTDGPMSLLNFLAARFGLAKRTFNKTTGVETQRNVADDASLGTATHTDDGTTVTKVKLT